MRLIGHLDDEARARLFGDFLFAQEIENQVEAEDHRWALWIHSEEHIPRARELLEEFVRDPANKKYLKATRVARQLREKLEEENVAARRRHFDSSALFASRVTRMGWVTAFLILGSLVVTFLTNFGSNLLFPRFFAIQLFTWEIWRWFTPVLVHMNLLHIFFNLLWLKDLGSLVETRLGSRSLLALVLVIAIPSNIAQCVLVGPYFGGMSGVVYGLLGYVWLRGRLDPSSGLFLDPFSFMIMAGWYVLCLLGIIGNVANVVHTVGLAIGLLLGYLASIRR